MGTKTPTIFFVSDFFIDEYQGGAELTTNALISDAPFNVTSVKSEDVNVSLIKENKEKYWVFGNMAGVPKETLLYAAKNLNYSIVEYDYKYCKYRSPQKHVFFEQKCDCQTQYCGKAISIFFANAKSLWFMSKKQKEYYENIFPFLRKQNSFVLSSVFDVPTLSTIKELERKKNEKWLIVDSPSWIKGTQDAIRHAQDHNLDYMLATNLPYRKMLETLASCKGLIFIPPGMDTCPRLVIEAKLLDCELIINENVQHVAEKWFVDKEDIFNYLEGRPQVFWNEIKKEI